MTGSAGWLATATVVAAYDLFAIRREGETMSTAYRSAYRAHPALVGITTAYLIGHLTGYLPARADVLRRIA